MFRNVIYLANWQYKMVIYKRQVHISQHFMVFGSYFHFKWQIFSNPRRDVKIGGCYKKSQCFYMGKSPSLHGLFSAMFTLLIMLILCQTCPDITFMILTPYLDIVLHRTIIKLHLNAYLKTNNATTEQKRSRKWLKEKSVCKIAGAVIFQ